MALHVRSMNVLLTSLGRRITLPIQQCFSNLPRKAAEDVVVLTDDGTTVVCWHPEQQFPYECSRPLPEMPVANSTDSVLNLQPADAYQVFRQKSDEVVRQELMKATHTTKHRWYPRSRDKFAKNTPPDREYL